MDDRKQLQALLERMEQSNDRQARYAKLQCVFSAVAAVCCLAVLVVVLTLLPRLQGMTDQMQTVLTNVEQVSDQIAAADVEGVMQNLEAVTQQMAQADLGGIAEDVSKLVQTSQTGLEDAMEKLNAIDLETLNQAIEDLAAVVRPLANFFGRGN